MSLELEFLERQRRDILLHMQAFPTDLHAKIKLAEVDRDLRDIQNQEIPLMGHMAKQPKRKVTVVEAPAPYDWKFINSPERTEGLRGVAEAEALNSRLFAESLTKEAAPRYTFGADYEQDQRWLAAERDKMDGVGDKQRTMPPTHPYCRARQILFSCHGI